MNEFLLRSLGGIAVSDLPFLFFCLFSSLLISLSWISLPSNMDLNKTQKISYVSLSTLFTIAIISANTLSIAGVLVIFIVGFWLFKLLNQAFDLDIIAVFLISLACANGFVFPCFLAVTLGIGIKFLLNKFG